MINNSLAQDPDYLRGDQYRDSRNLSARAELHSRFSVNPAGWHPWIFEQLDLAPGAKVLECGCGPGWLWRHNLDRLPAGCQVTLTDLSPGMVDEAEAALSTGAHHFSFDVADIARLTYDDDCFDVVIANHMFYHVPDRERAFAEVCRVLKPGGNFLAATNGRQHMRELRELGVELFCHGPAPGNLPELQEPAASAFGLENGQAQLAAWSDKIELYLYEDRLEVTEVGPLLDYIASSSVAKAHLTEQKREQIGQRIAQEIAEQGAFRRPGHMKGDTCGKKNHHTKSPIWPGPLLLSRGFRCQAHCSSP